MTFGLKEEIITKIQKVFSVFPEVEEAIVYGSRAKGNYKPGSDIDISLKGIMNLSTFNKIILALEDLPFPYIFDLSVYRQINNESLKEHIENVGQVIYKKAQDI